MRILVVEDEQAMADSPTRGLEAEGYVVDVADNGRDGLWKAVETAPDVVVLDVMLLLLDGYQVCRQLREQGVWTPILILTAAGRVPDLTNREVAVEDLIQQVLVLAVPATHAWLEVGRFERARITRRLIGPNVALQFRSRTRGVRAKYIFGTSLKGNDVSTGIYRDYFFTDSRACYGLSISADAPTMNSLRACSAALPRAERSSLESALWMLAHAS